ncbi:MAG: hypothetical protein AWU59_440 [Methanolobus sp. T82-4]|jgi:hypothetical protein|nr:MAG: hypothetical protein AWU59_440 [Methanolobus sp. T82-4]
MKRIVILTMVMLVAAMSLANAASVAPELFDNWQSGDAEFECEEAGACDYYSYKIDEWGNANYWGDSDMNGTYDGENINITNSDSYTFDWESTEYPVCAVIVKAGTGANVYYYPEGTYEDTGLYAYDEKEISHVTFCFGEEDDPGEPQEEIPEFPTVALPIAAILGLAFLFQRRKE